MIQLTLRFPLLVLLLSIPCLGNSQILRHIKKAEYYLAATKLDSASLEIDKAGKTILTASSAIKAKYCVVNGKIHKQFSEIGKALASYKRAEEYYLKKKDKDSVLLVKTLKAEVFRYGMLEKESLKEIKNAQGYLTKGCSPNIHAYFLNRKLAIYNYWLFDKEKALIDSLLVEILELKERVTDYETMAYTLNEQGNIIEKSVGQEASIPFYENALKYAVQHNLFVAGADISYNLGRLYQNQNHCHEAIAAYFVGINFAKKTNNVAQLSNLYHRLSFCHEFINELELAINYRDTAFLYVSMANSHENGVELQKIERRFNLNIKEKEIKLKNAEIQQFQSRYLYMLLFIGVIVLVFVILVINHRKTLRTNKKLDKLSTENEFLLREANHRIHNNLQLIIILINSELNKGNGEMENQLIKLQSQVDSIATLHKHLYQTDDKRLVHMEEYMHEIKINLNDHFVSKKVNVEFAIPHFSVATDQAMQIGLIVTELCINTLKHAFSDAHENRLVRLKMHAEKNSIEVSYQDNGDQLSGKEIKPKLVSQLLRQLKAEAQIDTQTGYHVKFKINR
jgi:two-component sensor histidine kinase